MISRNALAADLSALPEPVYSALLAGDFSRIRRDLAQRLHHPASRREQYACERGIFLLEQLPEEYCLSKEAALDIAKAAISGFSEEELEAYLHRGELDLIRLDGEERFFCRCVESLIEGFPALRERTFPEKRAQLLLNGEFFSHRDRCIQKIRRQGGMSCAVELKLGLSLKGQPLPPGEDATAYLPLPIRRPGQAEIAITGWCREPDHIAPDTHPQRTACWHTKNDPRPQVWLTVCYVSSMKYVDFSAVRVSENAGRDYTGEVSPHILFTPTVRQLAHALVSPEDTNTEKVIKLYDYLTTNFRYAYSRSYPLVPCLADYCLQRRRGDCGSLAVALIALCRVLGIPARSVGGTQLEDTRSYTHDWVEVLTDDRGWIPLDPFCGVVAHWQGREDVRRFYCGNIDPHRMISTQEFFAEFDPPAPCGRIDPYDNQVGELICRHQALAYQDIEFSLEILSLRDLPAET